MGHLFTLTHVISTKGRELSGCHEILGVLPFVTNDTIYCSTCLLRRNPNHEKICLKNMKGGLPRPSCFYKSVRISETCKQLVNNCKEFLQVGHLRISHVGNTESLALDLAVAVIKGITALAEKLLQSG